MKVIKKIIGFVFDTGFFLAGSLAVLVLAYQFGWTLLTGPLGWGNDIPFALSYVYYLNRWLPYFPRWHYEWAGGEAFLQNYPMLITYVTAFVHRLSGMTIIQIARLFYWLAVPVAGIGVMVLARLTVKHWLAAVLAGLFFVTMPESWLWATHGGFYAAQTSFPLMVFTFIGFELAWQKKQRAWWFLAIFCYGLTWLAHPTIAMTQTLGLGLYGLGRGLMEKRMLLGIKKSVLICLVGGLLAAFWVFPFIFSRPQGLEVGANQVVFVTLKEFLGLAPPRDGVYVTSTFFNGAVLVLAGLGAVLALVRKSIVRAMTACALLGLFIMTAPGFCPWLIRGPFLSMWAVMNVRASVLVRLFLPIMAAYGAVSMGESLFLLVAFFVKKLAKSFIWRFLRWTVGGVMALVFVWFIWQKVIIVPKTDYFYPGYGPVYSWVGPKKIDGRYMINEGKDPLFPSIEESLKRLLTFNVQLDDTKLARTDYYRELVNKLNLTGKDRVDIWPLGGDITAGWNTVTDVAQIPSYAGGIANLRMYGYQRGCFYNQNTPRCTGNEVQDLASWWGIKAVVIGENQRRGDVQLEANLKDNFTLQAVDVGEKVDFMVYRVPVNSGLASVSNKPLVLVIGDNPPQNDVFDTVYRSLGRIGFGYDKALSFDGTRFIDDYNLDELANYQIVILHGYQYRNYQRAWSLLSTYVQNGGSLLVDTGWQYQSEDWGMVDQSGSMVPAELAEPLPVAQTTWSNIGTVWKDLITVSPLTNQPISPKDWADPVWNGQPWGMALADPSGLRSFAQPLIMANNKIIAAYGNYGQGKVVWSGMNLFGHTSTYPSPNEDSLLFDVFSWLAPAKAPVEKKLEFDRVTPDKIVIELEPNAEGKQTVMFKELADPRWRAYLNGQKTVIAKTGPGWMLVALPDGFEGGELVLLYQRTILDWLWLAVSVLTGLGLLVYLLDGMFKGKIWQKTIGSKKISLGLVNKLAKGWKNE